MSVRISSLIWERSRQAGGDLLVFLALADYCSDAGRAYPSIPTLAAKCRMTPRHVQRVLRKIAGSGELDIHAGGPYGANLYAVNKAVLMSQEAHAPLTPASPPLTPMSPQEEGNTPDAHVTPPDIQTTPPDTGVALTPMSPPLTPASETPDAHVTPPLTPMSPKPSLNRQEPSEEEAPASAVAAADAAPIAARDGGQLDIADAVTGIPATAEQPMTAKERVWAIGPDLLGDTKGVRTFLGKLVAEFGEEGVAYALLKTAEAKPGGSLRSYVHAICSSRKTQIANAKKAAAAEKKGGMLDDPYPAWATQAGFANRFEAENEGCTAYTYRKFAQGKRVAA